MPLRAGRLGLLRRFRLAARLWQGADDLFSGHPPRERAQVTLLERALRAKRHLNHLIAIGGSARGVSTVQRDVPDPEPDLRLGLTPPASNTVTFGEPELRKVVGEGPGGLSALGFRWGRRHPTVPWPTDGPSQPPTRLAGAEFPDSTIGLDLAAISGHARV